MNKSELIDVIAKKADISKAAAGRSLDAVIDSIVEAVSKGDQVTLIGFGSFKKSHRPARKGMNPKTKQPIDIKATDLPKFSAGSDFKAKVAKGC